MPRTPSLVPTIENFDALFCDFNKRFYDGTLEPPVITASPKGHRNALDWFTLWRAWKEDGTDGHYEINVCADYLNRPFEEICETLLHEMAHLYNKQIGIRDCSRNVPYSVYQTMKPQPQYIIQYRASKPGIFLSFPLHTTLF